MSKTPIKAYEPAQQKPAYTLAERRDLQPAPIRKPEPIDYGPHKVGNGLPGKG